MCWWVTHSFTLIDYINRDCTACWLVHWDRKTCWLVHWDRTTCWLVHWDCTTCWLAHWDRTTCWLAHSTETVQHADWSTETVQHADWSTETVQHADWSKAVRLSWFSIMCFEMIFRMKTLAQGPMSGTSLMWANLNPSVRKVWEDSHLKTGE